MYEMLSLEVWSKKDDFRVAQFKEMGIKKLGKQKGRGVWGEMDTYSWMPLLSPETITTLLISFQFSRSVVFDSETPWTAACQASLSITNFWSLLKVMSIEWWCYLTILSPVVPFSRLQSFPASGSFLVSQFFTSGGQSIGVSASASVLSKHIQDWFLLGWTGWISLQSKGFSIVFSNTTVQKHQLFGTQSSL